MLPAEIDRIMPAGPASAVFVYALVPQKLVGWPLALSRSQRALLPAKYARLPVVGQLGGPTRRQPPTMWNGCIPI